MITPTTPTATASTTLPDRIALLERLHHGCDDASNQQTGGVVNHVDDSMRRARCAVEDAAIYSAVWRWVPPDYYTWPLQQRADCLQAPSKQYLCKSLLLENKKAHKSDDPTFPKYVMVLLQYSASLDSKALVNAIRALRPVKTRMDASQFDFRIASQADNDRLTGYQHNSVSPFGLLVPDQVLMVLAKDIVDKLKFLWMGGGHVHLKLGMAVSDFIHVLNPLVAPVTTPRTDLESALDDDPAELVDEVQRRLDQRRAREAAGTDQTAEMELTRTSSGDMTPVLTPEMQAIMEKRRQQEQQQGNSLSLPSTPNRPTVAASTLSPEMQAIMDRQKNHAGRTMEISSPSKASAHTQLNPEVQAMMEKRQAKAGQPIDIPANHNKTSSHTQLNPEVQAVMDRRKQATGSIQIPTSPSKKASAHTQLNPEVQAMMEKRRLRQQQGAAVQAETKKDTQAMKGFSMNSEMQAVMERRRNAEEAATAAAEQEDKQS